MIWMLKFYLDCMQRKVFFAGVAGVLYGHSKQSMIFMEGTAKAKEAKADQDRVKSEATTSKSQLAAANTLLDKYRARYPDFEEKKVDTADSASSTKFTYSSLEAGEFIEKFATSYDGPEKGDAWNADGANDTIVGAENRS